MQEEVVGVDVEVAVIADESAVDAAIVGVADAIELARVAYGQAT